MPKETWSITVESEAERAAILAALAMYREVADVGQTAPAGEVLDYCEQAALDRGRDWMRMTLQDAVQRRADEAQKKGHPSAPAPVVAAAATKANRRAT
jgi:hypothetical protein